MVILFSGRNNRYEKEITEILTGIGANYISDKAIHSGTAEITIISEYKKTDLKINNGIALFLDDTERFVNQSFPKGLIGICEDCNKSAIKLFSKDKIPVITCGMNSKNTITCSSIDGENLIFSLQRSIVNLHGKEIEPAEYRIKLKSNYLPYSVMASVAVMLLCGKMPKML